MLIFLIVLICCVVVCEIVSQQSALKRVGYTCKPTSSVVEPGEEFELVTTLTNGKWLPVSYLGVVQSLPNDIQLNAYLGRFSSEPTVARLYSSCFLMPKQRLERRIKATLPQRGRHFILDATLTAGDLLGLSTRTEEVHLFYEIVVLPGRVDAPDLSRALGGFLGDVSVRRFILEDPVLTIGTREYTGHEPMKTISWKHSARSGQLMVKKFDYTVENSVTVLLNVDGNTDYDTLERCFSLARMVVEQLETRGLQYGFLTNAATAGALGRWSEVAEGLGGGHTRTILEGLGRATHDVQEPFENLLQRAVRRSERGRAHIIVTPGRMAEDDPLLARLREQSDGRIFLLSAEELAEEQAEGRAAS